MRAIRMSEAAARSGPTPMPAGSIPGCRTPRTTSCKRIAAGAVEGEPVDDAQGHRPDQQRSADQPGRELAAGRPGDDAVSGAAGGRPAVPVAGRHRDCWPGRRRGLWRAVWGSALGLVLGSACAVLTAGLLLIVDQFSAYLLGDAQAAAQDGIKKAFAMDGAIEGSGWLVVTVIAGAGDPGLGDDHRDAVPAEGDDHRHRGVRAVRDGRPGQRENQVVGGQMGRGRLRAGAVEVRDLRDPDPGLQRGRVLDHRGHHRRPARVGVGAARRVLPAGGAAVRALRRRPDQLRRTPPARPAPWATRGRPVTWAKPGPAAVGGVVGGAAGWLAGRAGTAAEALPPSPASAVGGPAATAGSPAQRQQASHRPDSPTTATGAGLGQPQRVDCGNASRQR